MAEASVAKASEIPLRRFTAVGVLQLVPVVAPTTARAGSSAAVWVDTEERATPMKVGDASE
jgi:hypothetical protein